MFAWIFKLDFSGTNYVENRTFFLKKANNYKLIVLFLILYMASTSSSAVRALSLELKSFQEEPMEGFRVKLLNEDCMFEWEVAIFGPPGTLYEGAYFKAILRFPSDYPYSPPSMRFISKVWHPNVYENGDLCISILHPPVDDPHSGELPCERWNPTQNVRTILLSVISLLNEPNCSSPANVDASVMYRRWKESKGLDEEYAKMIKKQVELSRVEAEKDGVVVPMTLEEYCIKPKMNNMCSSGSHHKGHYSDALNSLDFYDEYYDYGDDDDEDQAEGCADDEDSGQGET